MYGQESIRRSGVAIIVNKRPKYRTWMQAQKLQNDLCLFPRQTIQPTRLLELTPPKNVLFIIGGWNAKVGSQELPGVTRKFGLGIQNEAGQRLREFCQENALVIANILFQKHKRRLYTWTSPDGQYQNQIGYIPCS